MTDDCIGLNGDQRENCIACSAQIVDQVRFGEVAKRGFVNGADRPNLTGRFKSGNHSSHQHRFDRGGRLAQAW